MYVPKFWRSLLGSELKSVMIRARQIFASTGQLNFKRWQVDGRHVMLRAGVIFNRVASQGILERAIEQRRQLAEEFFPSKERGGCSMEDPKFRARLDELTVPELRLAMWLAGGGGPKPKMPRPAPLKARPEPAPAPEQSAVHDQEWQVLDQGEVLPPSKAVVPFRSPSAPFNPPSQHSVTRGS